MKMLKASRQARDEGESAFIRGVKFRRGSSLVDGYAGQAMPGVYVIALLDTCDVYVGRSGQLLVRVDAHLAGCSSAPHAQRISLTPVEDIAVYYVPGCWLKGDTGEQAARAEKLLAAVLQPSLSRSTTKGRFSVKAQHLGRATRDRLSRVACFAELRPDLCGDPLYRLEWIARIARRGELDHLSREERLDVAVGSIVGSAKLNRPLRDILERQGYGVL
ncbi:MAG: hypothetical protein J0M00_03465 [Burkholderiales bacterium]|nr:hypothetical protein [Burkholderiales bacterium]